MIRMPCSEATIQMELPLFQKYQMRWALASALTAVFLHVGVAPSDASVPFQHGTADSIILGAAPYSLERIPDPW